MQYKPIYKYPTNRRKIKIDFTAIFIIVIVTWIVISSCSIQYYNNHNLGIPAWNFWKLITIINAPVIQSS